MLIDADVLVAAPVILLSYLLPFAYKPFRPARGGVFLAFWVILTFHHIISVYNCFFETLPGANADAIRFHNTAALYSQSLFGAPFGSDSKFYEWFLAHIYRISTPSLFLAQSMVVLAFAFSTVYLLKLKNIVGIFKYDATAMIFFGMEPFVLIWTSVNLREAYQILFLLMALYFGLLWRLRREGAALVKFVASILLLAILHNGLSVYSIFLLFIFISWNFNSQKESAFFSRRRVKKTLVLVPAFIAIALVALNLPSMGALQAVQTGNVVEYANSYRHGSIDSIGGSTYGAPIDFSSPFGFMVTGAGALSHYFFGPFPWEVRSFIDAIAALVVLFHAALLLSSIVFWRSSSGYQRHAAGILLTAYLILEFMWASGTTNYGTAMRHHMVAYGIIVVLGAPSFISFITKPFRRRGRLASYL